MQRYNPRRGLFLSRILQMCTKLLYIGIHKPIDQLKLWPLPLISNPPKIVYYIIMYTFKASYLVLMCTVNSLLYKPRSHMKPKDRTLSSISHSPCINVANRYSPEIIWRTCAISLLCMSYSILLGKGISVTKDGCLPKISIPTFENTACVEGWEGSLVHKYPISLHQFFISPK